MASTAAAIFLRVLGAASYAPIPASNLTDVEEMRMFRSFLYVVGFTVFAAAWAVYQEQRKLRHLPANKAAAMLKKAWADHHTTA